MDATYCRFDSCNEMHKKTQTLRTCRTEDCYYKGLQMHETCFDNAHRLAPHHKAGSTIETVSTELGVGSSELSSCATTLGSASSAGIAAAAGGLTHVSVELTKAIADAASKGILFTPTRTTQIAAAMGETAGSAASALHCGYAVAISVALETGFNYYSLSKFEITPQEFGIRTAGAVAGGAGSFGGGFGGMLAGVNVGARASPVAGIVLGVVGAVGGGMCAGYAARKYTESLVRWGCGEDKCRTALMVGEALTELRMLSYDPMHVTQEGLDSQFRRLALINHPDKLHRNEREDADAFDDRKVNAIKEFSKLAHCHVLCTNFVNDRDLPVWKEGPIDYLRHMIAEKRRQSEMS